MAIQKYIYFPAIDNQFFNQPQKIPGPGSGDGACSPPTPLRESTSREPLLPPLYLEICPSTTGAVVSAAIVSRYTCVPRRTISLFLTLVIAVLVWMTVSSAISAARGRAVLRGVLTVHAGAARLSSRAGCRTPPFLCHSSDEMKNRTKYAILCTSGTTQSRMALGSIGHGRV
jgi:hypothetical protein